MRNANVIVSDTRFVTVKRTYFVNSQYSSVEDIEEVWFRDGRKEVCINFLR